MRTNRQLAYLEALDIPVWVRKDASPVALQAEALADEGPVADSALQAATTVAETPAAEAPLQVAAASATESRPVGLRLGPGTGRFLLLCANADETSSKLAADISRSFAEAPVWAWPDSSANSVMPEAVVQEHLFTALVVFGETHAQRVFGSPVPEMLGPARVLVAPEMDKLLADPGARHRLWKIMVANRLAVKP